jgi:hypothetical protein
MTQDEIIEMARQVEFNAGFNWCVNFIELEAFAKLVAAKEREACSELAENCDPRANHRGIASAIRARGEA